MIGVQGGPLLVTNGVITPISRVISPQLSIYFAAIDRDPLSPHLYPFITIASGPTLWDILIFLLHVLSLANPRRIRSYIQLRGHGSMMVVPFLQLPPIRSSRYADTLKKTYPLPQVIWYFSGSCGFPFQNYRTTSGPTRRP